MPTDLSSPTEATELMDPASIARVKRYCWIVCGLLFLATTISYVDRMVFSVLAHDLQGRFHITEIQYGYLGSAFTLCYALSQLLSGPLLDRVGTRLGLLLAMILWSVASMTHAVCRTALQFFVARAALGISESPSFPGATKGVSEWFPAKQRGIAMGVVNAGSNVGVLVAVIVIPWLKVHFGWQAVFVMTGSFGFFWAAVWIPIYRNPVIRLRTHTAAGEPSPPIVKLRWRSLLTYRQAWAICLGKFFTDPSWWFYVAWLPKFMQERHGLDLIHIGPPLVIIYVMADIGSVCGGWISSDLLARGWSMNAARKTAMLLCAITALPLILAPHASSVWTASFLIGLATASHQGYSSNLFVLCSDFFPSNSVSTIAGMAGTFGYSGAMLLSALIGYILTWTHQSYNMIFAIAGLSYLTSLTVMHCVAPEFKAVEVPEPRASAFSDH
jgi:ACS family hexuronate transporter-like MFS transporter